MDRDAHVRQLLGRFQGTDRQAQQLAEIASRPAEQSLFDSMQLFYLDRMLLAVVCLVVAWCLAHAVDGPWAEIGALTCVGIIFAALNAALGKQRRTDAHPMLRAAARSRAQVYDACYIVRGHGLRSVEEPVANSNRQSKLACGD